MSPTPNLGLPYPQLTDTADVPRDIKALADAVDAAFHPQQFAEVTAGPVPIATGGTPTSVGSWGAPITTPFLLGSAAGLTARVAGTFLFTVFVRWDAGSGTRLINFAGAAQVPTNQIGGDNSAIGGGDNMTLFVTLPVNGLVTVAIFQNSGATINVQSIQMRGVFLGLLTPPSS